MGGKSRKKKGIFGDYVEHRDKHGKKIGESRKQSGFFGDYVEHRDEQGKKVGESREQTGFFGDYVAHRDEQGRKVGESREQTGFFGDYVEHRDEHGKKVGESRERAGLFGDYTEHTDNSSFGHSKPKKKTTPIAKKNNHIGSGDSGGVGDYDLPWFIWLPFLPAMLCLLLFFIPFFFFEKNKKIASILEMLGKPMETLGENAGKAYLIASFIFYLFFSDSDWSNTTNIIFALAHPLIILVVLFLGGVAILLSLLASIFPGAPEMPNNILYLYFSVMIITPVSYYLIGLLFLIFRKIWSVGESD